MNTCEACKASLTQADLDRGRCPACGCSLTAPATPGEASPVVDRSAQTFQAGTVQIPDLPSDMAGEPSPVIDRSAQTLQAGTVQIPGAQSDIAGEAEARSAA